MKSHNIILGFHGKLITNLFKADGKVTIAAFTAGIYNDTIITILERRMKSTLKINRMSTCITIKHNPIF